MTNLESLMAKRNSIARLERFTGLQADGKLRNLFFWCQAFVGHERAKIFEVLLLFSAGITLAMQALGGLNLPFLYEVDEEEAKKLPGAGKTVTSGAHHGVSGGTAREPPEEPATPPLDP